jgi:hypothetical protein
MAVIVGHPFDLVKVRMQTGTVEGAKNSVFSVSFFFCRMNDLTTAHSSKSLTLLPSREDHATNFGNRGDCWAISRCVGSNHSCESNLCDIILVS